MKRITVTTTYLLVVSTLSFVQLPPSRAAIGQSPLLTLHAPAPTPSAPPSDQVTPLSNLPFFPGGTPALENYLGSLDIYPLRAREIHLEGTVRVRLRVLQNAPDCRADRTVCYGLVPVHPFRFPRPHQRPIRHRLGRHYR